MTINKILFFFFVPSLLLGQQVQMVYDIFPGVNWGYNSSVGVVVDDNNETAFFSGNNGQGYEIWKTDGSASGTILLKDIAPDSFPTQPRDLIKLGEDSFVFRIDDGVHGDELWYSDGSEANTRMIKDLTPGVNSTRFGSFLNFQSNVFFTMIANSTDVELWRTDGTESGTYSIATLSTGFTHPVVPPRANFGVDGDLFYVCPSFFYKDGLWKSDGTIAGTVRVPVESSTDTLTNCTSFYQLGNRMLFTGGSSNDTLSNLWETDGTVNGTKIVKNFNAIGGGPSMRSWEATIEHLFFSIGNDLWVSDGTDAGTESIASDLNLNWGTASAQFAWKNHFYFTIQEANAQVVLYRVKDDILEPERLFVIAPPDMLFSSYSSADFIADDNYLYLTIADSITTNGGYSEAIARLPYGANSLDAIIKTNSWAVSDKFLMGESIYFRGLDIEQNFGQELYRADIGNLVETQNVVKLSPPQIIPTLSKTGQFTLKTTQNQAKTGHISVYDLSGKLLHKQKVGEGQTDLNLTELSSGFYIIQLLDAQGSLLGAQKVIIEK